MIPNGRESGVEQGTRSWSEASLKIRLQEGASVGTPWLLEEDMAKEVPFLSICLSIYLSTNNKLWAPFENKMRDIFL